MHICVVGVGYVGLVTGACFAEFGVTVTCVDKDETRIGLLKNGQVPFYEPGLEELVRKNIAEGRLSFTTDAGVAIRQALVVFIAVGTPSAPDGSADLQYIREVAGTIGRNLDGYKVVVTKSTVPVGTGQMIAQIIEKERTSDFAYDVVSNPEFLREGAAIEDFMRPNRVVIGADSDQAVAILKDLYSPLYLIETPFVITDVQTSEMIKYASNAFLATKVSFINEMANICEQVGDDVHRVAKGMGLDGRIGPKFLHPGPGYGGSCFPKDVKALIAFSREVGYEPTLLDDVEKINKEQPLKAVEYCRKLVGDLRGKRVAVLGLSFKPLTDDMREAKSIPIIKELLKEGANVSAYDPVAVANAKVILKDTIEYAPSTVDCLKNSDCCILVTEWEEFKELDLKKIKEVMDNPIIIDGRNVYDPSEVRKLGFNYIFHRNRCFPS